MMGNFRTGLFSLLLLLVCACSGPRLDERYAASVVKQELCLSSDVTATKIHGGYSGANIFLATDGSKKYIIKFIGSHPEREIYNSKVASIEFKSMLTELLKNTESQEFATALQLLSKQD